MGDVGFRPPAPCLVPRTPRVVTLPEELGRISSAASQMREKIEEHIEATLGGVKVGLRTSQPSSSAGVHSFVSIPDDMLRDMDRDKLLEYASSYRDHCEQVIRKQMHTMGEVCTSMFCFILKYTFIR